MSDTTSQTPEVWIDEETATRLTAWVLGEASEYEIAALEELVATDKRAATYLAELREVHGLLGQEDEEVWELPKERRAELLRTLGSEVEKPVAAETKISRRWPQAIGVAAALGLCAGLPLYLARQDGGDTWAKYSAAPESSPAEIEVIREFVYPKEDTAFEKPESGSLGLGEDFGDGFGDEGAVADIMPRRAAKDGGGGAGGGGAVADIVPGRAEGSPAKKSRVVVASPVPFEEVAVPLDEIVIVEEGGAFGADQEQLAQKRARNGQLRGYDFFFEAPEPSALISVTDQPTSTFSLNISDASYQMARVNLLNGSVVTPSSVRVEEFYNAHDYGDPTPSENEPVACTIEQAAHPTELGQNLLRIGIRTGAEGRLPNQPLHITVLLDNSGSMQREDRRMAAQQALNGLSLALGERDQLSVLNFAAEPRLVVDQAPGADANGQLQQAFAMKSEGGTDLGAALEAAAEHALPNAGVAQSRIVLLTDGGANLGQDDARILADQVVATRQQGIALDVAGVGAGDANDRLLEEISRNGDGRYFALNGVENEEQEFAEKLAGAFRPAAQDVKVQVVFNAARVESYALQGFDQHRLAEEDFRNDRVDGAELAAEESGNALYSLKLKADGQGNIGTVSVRFRDTATDSMMEREWVIPYEEGVVPFEEARPSLQLAGLSNIAAQNLQGAPVDWSHLQNSIANVGQHYRADDKVTEFLEVLDLLQK